MSVSLQMGFSTATGPMGRARRVDTLTVKLDDVELLRRHLGGTQWAFPELVRRYHRQLWWAIRSSRVPVEHHMDVLQEGLLRIHRFAAKFRGLSHESTATVGTWMVAIMRNVCHTFWVQHDKHNDGHMSYEDHLEVHEHGQTASRNRQFGDGCMERAVVRMDVHRALGRLSPELKDVMVHTGLRGMRVEDYARKEGIPVGTVKSRRNRAKRQLQQLLEPADYSVANAG